MKKLDLTKKTAAELTALVAEYQKDLLDARFSFAGSKSKNVHEGKMKRKEIARMMARIGTAN